MSDLIKFWNLVPSYLKNRYALTVFAFIVWMLFFDTNTLVSQVRMRAQLDDMKAQKAYYEQEVKIVHKSLNELLHDADSQERFAREKYFMKKDNEEVFIIEGEF